MQSFEELSAEFATRFNQGHFPDHPASLYQPAGYFLSMGGKRIRPVLCLMGNELFGPVEDDAPDYELPVWAGLIPLTLVPGAPVRDERCDPAIPVPPYAANYTR